MRFGEVVGRLSTRPYDACNGFSWGLIRDTIADLLSQLIIQVSRYKVPKVMLGIVFVAEPNTSTNMSGKPKVLDPVTGL